MLRRLFRARHLLLLYNPVFVGCEGDCVCVSLVYKILDQAMGKRKVWIDRWGRGMEKERKKLNKYSIFNRLIIDYTSHSPQSLSH